MTHIKTLAIGTAAFGLLTLVAACGEDDDSDTHSRDTASGPDDSGELPPNCLGSISGRVLENGRDPMDANVVICIGLTCFTGIRTDSRGDFQFILPMDEDESCLRYDFTKDRIHIEINASDDLESHAAYAFVRQPEQADISDLGDDDYDYDVGPLALYELPTENAVYAPDTGAAVDLGNVSFELAPHQLVKTDISEDVPIAHNQAVSVFEAPLDEWAPPFVDTPIEALYLIAPRWAKLAGDGVSLSIAPPDGWSEGDAGTLYVLGGYVTEWGDPEEMSTGGYLYVSDDRSSCQNEGDDTENLERIEDGVFSECGRIELIDGRLVTSPLPRFTWVGIATD